MDKKGQLYIVAAIIICIVVFGIVVDMNKIYEGASVTGFQELSKNYITEAPKMINYVISHPGEDIEEILSSFSHDFVAYARVKDPNIGLVYVYGDDAETVIANYLPSGEIVEYYPAGGGGGALFSSAENTINSVSVSLAGEDFGIEVPVALSEFNKKYFSDSTSQSDYVVLDVAGVLHTLDLCQGIPQFGVVVKSGKDDDITSIVQSGELGVC